MLQIKDWVLIVGILVAWAGYECMPHGQHADAEQNLSVFAQSADAGAFLSFGSVTLILGLLIVCISFVLPRR